MIATGGIGGLYAESTNPLGSFAQGLALAARAGAVLADMEFVQFHPTALDVPLRPMPLVSEAVRGEGAKLIDARGERFMAGVPGAELAPRDVVARAIWRLRQSGGRAFLDARAAIGDKFAARFPAIAAACRAAGIDPAREPIPSGRRSTIIWAGSRWTPRGGALSPDSGPAVKRPRPGCTAQTGWRATPWPRPPSMPRSLRARSTARSPGRLRHRAPRARLPPPIQPPSVRSFRTPRGSCATATRSPPPSARFGVGGREWARRRSGRRRAHDRCRGAPPRAQPRRPLPNRFPAAPAARFRSRLTLDEAFAVAAAFSPPVRIRRA